MANATRCSTGWRPEMTCQLNQELWFPDPTALQKGRGPEGLVAVDGDLSVERLLLAYRSGIFPWSVDPISWWSPDPRGIFELDQFHVSRSLARTLRRGVFTIKRNSAFDRVVEGCARSAPGRESTWIHPDIMAAYSRLHQEGHAHSVECWSDGELVGGVYGVAIGGAFFAESMFHTAPDASKVALYSLMQGLGEEGFGVFDIQMITPFTRSLGAVWVSRESYLVRLREALGRPCSFAS